MQPPSLLESPNQAAAGLGQAICRGTFPEFLLLQISSQCESGQPHPQAVIIITCTQSPLGCDPVTTFLLCRKSIYAEVHRPETKADLKLQ